jgi:hypothetical protein
VVLAKSEEGEWHGVQGLGLVRCLSSQIEHFQPPREAGEAETGRNIMVCEELGEYCKFVTVVIIAALEQIIRVRLKSFLIRASGTGSVSYWQVGLDGGNVGAFLKGRGKLGNASHNDGYIQPMRSWRGGLLPCGGKSSYRRSGIGGLQIQWAADGSYWLRVDLSLAGRRSEAPTFQHAELLSYTRHRVRIKKGKYLFCSRVAQLISCFLASSGRQPIISFFEAFYRRPAK